MLNAKFHLTISTPVIATATTSVLPISTDIDEMLCYTWVSANGPRYPFVVQLYEVYATLIRYLLILSRSLGNSGIHT